MNRKKMVLIGAGSAMFTQGLVADLILAPELGPWTVGLVDIDPEALEMVERLVRRMIEARAADVELSASTDRGDVLPGADVVVTTIAVGGRRAWETDVFIPRQYGVFQPVGDSVMPGGISRALRQIPPMLDIARDVQRLCPNAYFFNYSNPMTTTCRAVRQATGAAVVGLCHGVMHTERELARFAGLPPEEVTTLAVGVNHLTWIYDFRWRGRDAWPIVRARLAEERNEPVDAAALGREFPEMGARPEDAPRAAHNPFSWSMFDIYGAYPAPNDRHTVEFFPAQFSGGAYYGRTLGVDAFSLEATIEHGDRVYEMMKARALGQQPLDEGLFQRRAGEHEQLLAIVSSLWRDERRIFSVNLPNGGAVPNLPAAAVLELPAAATGRGFCPLLITDFPDPLAALMHRVIAAQELTVAAALTGRRDLFVEALLADGAVADRATAGKLADDLLAAQREHLPQFA